MAQTRDINLPANAASEDHYHLYQPQNEEEVFRRDVTSLLQRIRSVDTANILDKLGEEDGQGEFVTFVDILQFFSTCLIQGGRRREAEVFQYVIHQCTEDHFHGGLGLLPSETLTRETRAAVIFQVEAWLQSLNSEDNARKLLQPLSSKPANRRPMTLSQKILAHHAIGKIAPEGLAVGDLVRVSVDWVVSSELAWEVLQSLMDSKGADTIFRNDRLWLAGDHRVDPRNYHTPISQRMIQATEKAQRDYKLTDYKGSNYTIIHTEFVRERAEPGALVIGADSHTCSAGAVGCLAIGLGAEDVVVPLITGETWFKVPACISIRFTNEPLPGIGGKDVILFILKELKRNTVAANRIVEFSGPGLKHLSTDARFSISNMCTEFGAVTGIFVPDDETQNYVKSRRQKKGRSSSIYFQPDSNAVYAQTFEIDLSKVKPFIALYPSPDNVVLVTEQSGKKLDGCFIGACTTTEEDLVLAGLVLEAGLAEGIPCAPGSRHVTPGSLPIVKRLEQLGLLEVYEKAGFSRGAPGCSYCVGVADTAPAGSVWLSSQNRNFPNRMGKGSVANLASAVTVAASSFSMEVSDPTALLAKIDLNIWNEYKRLSRDKKPKAQTVKSPQQETYVEPNFEYKAPNLSIAARTKVKPKSNKQQSEHIIKSRVITLGDFIDTDALSPSEFLSTAKTDEDLGEHCMEHTVPDFRIKVKQGQKVVVAGNAFGVGSSRETAPRALKGLGVQCVIARSFAFIYARNQPNLGLLGIVLDNDNFHAAATDGVDIKIDLDAREVCVAGRAYKFHLDDMELALVANGGMNDAYRRFGKQVFEKLAMDSESEGTREEEGASQGEPMKELQW